MALSDPITITIAGTAKTFSRISTSGSRTVYRTSDGLYDLTVSHQDGKRRRTSVRINKYSTTSDPFLTDRNVPITTSFYMVFDTEQLVIDGTGATDQKDSAVGLFNWLTASTNAALIKIIAGES